MRKGLLASVAALAASAGVSLGQYPPAAPATPAGYPMPVDGVPPPMPLPPATEYPHNGPVPGPGSYPGGFDPHQDQPGGHGDFTKAPKHRRGEGAEQAHKAAGGPDHLWVDVELLLWVVRPMPIPFPLVVNGPPASGGLLGLDGVNVLYGAENIDYNDTNKALRLSGGWWDSCRKWGFEASGFIQEGTSQFGDFFNTRTANTLLARPVINAITGVSDAFIVGFGVPPFDPNGGVGFDGEIHVSNRIQFGGAEANILRSLAYYDKFKFNLLAGIRYVDIDEQLDIISKTTDPRFAVDPVGDPDVTVVSDSFGVRNQFLGLNLGFQSSLRCGRFFVDTTGKVAVGNTNEHLRVSGFTQRRISGVDSLQNGGLLALESNIIDVKENEFALLPELTVKVGYNLTQRCSVYVGYTGLYLSRLMRPGDQIDPNVNPVFVPVSNQFPGNFPPVKPANSFNQADFWAQGVTLGFSVKY